MHGQEFTVKTRNALDSHVKQLYSVLLIHVLQNRWQARI